MNNTNASFAAEPPAALVFNHPYLYETERLIRAFFPPFKAEILQNVRYNGENYILSEIFSDVDNSSLIITACINIGSYNKYESERVPIDADDHEKERLICAALYHLLTEYTGQRPSWGILTGIRPVRLLENTEKKLGSREKADKFFTEKMLVSTEKLALAHRISAVQSPIISSIPKNSFALYVSVPFCPSRCSYCSFVSHSAEKAGKLIPEYVDKLFAEITAIADMANRLGLRPDSVYFGGGTPTVLNAEQLKMLFLAVERFDLSAVREYTVEAGRPDTVTKEKLLAIKSAGARRISINPQTLQNDVLKAIGRRHTAEEFFVAYSLAREVGFDCINTDLIAGLPTDDFDGFAETLEKILSLDPKNPENITVHSLSLKRSSTLFHENERDLLGGVGKMVSFAEKTLTAAGYSPYYLYRQKNTVENHENIGYAKPGAEGLYNIAIMEEVQTILAAGCAGSTKIVGKNGIKRMCNFKYPYEYLTRFEEVLRKVEGVQESIVKING